MDSKRKGLAFGLAGLAVFGCLATGFSSKPAALGPLPAPVQAMAATATATAIPTVTASRQPTEAPQVVPSVARPSVDPPAAPRPTVVPDVAYHVPVLTYHRIVPRKESGKSLASMVVEPALFRAQLSKLHTAGWHTVTLEQLARAMASGAPVPPKTFAITIDDGWDDGYRYAFPIMRELGFDATYFVISSRVGAPSFLSAPQLLEMQAAGFEIGNHTMDHALLSSLSYREALADISGASDALARTLGRRPVSLAYPKGGVAPFVLDAARACPGIEIAVTTVAGRTETWRTRFETPRLGVDSSVTPAALLAELTAGR